jgi:DNA-binding protein YbaB
MFGPIDAIKAKRTQSKMQKELEEIFAMAENRDIKVVVRGDHKIEKIEIEGEEQKELRSVINDAMKALEKKIQKKMSSAANLEDLKEMLSEL